MVVELYTAKQLFGSEVKEFMANTKLKNAHNLINNVFTKNAPHFLESKWSQAQLHVMTNNPTKYERILSYCFRGQR